MASPDYAEMCQAVVKSSAAVEALLAAVPDHEKDFATACGDMIVSTVNGDCDADVSASLMQLVAEAAKVDEARDVLAEKGMVVACIKVLKQSQASSHGAGMLQALRATGNLCVDCDANRAQLMKNGGLPVVIEVLQSLGGSNADVAEKEKISIVSTGAMLNAAAGSDDMRKSLISAGAIESLVGVFRGDNPMAKSFALRALAQFFAHKDALATIAKGGIIPDLIDIVAKSDSFEDCEDVIDLLHGMADNADIAPAFLENGSAERLMELSRGDGSSQIVQKSAIMVSMLLSCDDCLKVLFDDGEKGDALLSTFLHWMQPQNGPDMRIAGALCIGNIARSDATASRLANTDGLLDCLLAMAQENLSGLKHAGLGSLKNLAIMAENKPLILNLGGAKALQPGLEDSQAVLQYGAASLLRSLCLKQPKETVVEIASLENMVPRLIHLSKSEELATRCEATRCLGVFIRVKDAALNEKIVEANAIPSFAAMLEIESQMMGKEAVALLRSEALLSLACLSIDSTSNCNAMVENDVLTKLVNLLKGTEDDQPTPDVICNGMSLGCTLFKYQGPPACSQESTDAFKALVDTLKEHESAPVKQQATAAAVILSS